MLAYISSPKFPHGGPLPFQFHTFHVFLVPQEISAFDNDNGTLIGHTNQDYGDEGVTDGRIGIPIIGSFFKI